MKRLLWTVPLFLVLMTGSAWANLADEIIVLAQNNVSEDVMVAFINENPRGVSGLSANDIVRLKDAGVTDRVINALIVKMGAAAPGGEGQAPAAPVYTDQQPQSQPVVVSSPAPVYDYTYYLDTSYPVPIYCDYPPFPFGVDLFVLPWWHHCFQFDCPLFFTDLSFCCGWPHFWNSFCFGSAPPCFFRHRTFVTTNTFGSVFNRRLMGTGSLSTRTGFASAMLSPARVTMATLGTGRPARGTVLAASSNLAARAPVASRWSQVQSPVVRRLEPARASQTHSYAPSRSESFAARSAHSYSAPSYHSYSSPSYHSFSAPSSHSYHSYAAPRSSSYGGGGYHSYGGGSRGFGGGGSHSFGGGGFHSGFGGHHR